MLAVVCLRMKLILSLVQMMLGVMFVWLMLLVRLLTLVVRRIRLLKVFVSQTHLMRQIRGVQILLRLADTEPRIVRLVRISLILAVALRIYMVIRMVPVIRLVWIWVLRMLVRATIVATAKLSLRLVRQTRSLGLGVRLLMI